MSYKEILLNKAEEYLNFDSIVYINEAIEILKYLNDYKNSKELLREAEKKLNLLVNETDIELENYLKKCLKHNERKKSVQLGVAFIALIIVITSVIINTVIIPNKNYNEVVNMMENGKYEEVVRALEDLDGYKDSQELLQEYKYNYAVSLINEATYDEVVLALQSLGGYKDSLAVLEKYKYDYAISVFNSNKYEDAISLFENLNGYKESNKYIELCNNAIKDIQYNDALKYINEKKYVDAYDLLYTLDGYKDSKKKMQSIYNDYIIMKLKNSNEGDCVIFGKYEQDDNTENGKEDIEWIVLKKKNNEILLLSKNILEYKSFNTKNKIVVWKDSTIRKWLNNNFYNSFTKFQKGKIIKKTISTQKNEGLIQKYSKIIKTSDYIFLLSDNDYGNYRTIITSQIAKQGHWWIRTTRYKHGTAYYVDNDAKGIYGTEKVNREDIGVRPAMWISLE